MRIGLWAAAALLWGASGCTMEHQCLPQTAEPLPSDWQAHALLERRCSSCHSLERIYGSQGTLEEWMAVVHRMAYHHKAKLLTHLRDDEARGLARWLAERQGPDQQRTRIGPRESGRPL